MYFWQIEKLKDQIVARPLSDREILPYLVVFVGLSAMGGFIPVGKLNIWDQPKAGFNVGLGVLGTLWIYRLNGGAKGQFLLQRYFVIGWVVGIRWLVAVIIVGVPIYAAKALLTEDSEPTTWYEALFFAVAELVLYFRIGSHVQDVAIRTESV